MCPSPKSFQPDGESLPLNVRIGVLLGARLHLSEGGNRKHLIWQVQIKASQPK